MNDFERELLCCLANCVRYMTLEQVARGWFQGQVTALVQARRRLLRLARSGWISQHRVLARPIQRLQRPLVTWQSRGAVADFAVLANFLRRRARQRAQLTRIARATLRTRIFWGDARTGPQVKLTQTTHDLHVAEIFLQYRQRGGELCGWCNEDQIPRSWPFRVRPDALLIDDEGTWLRAIEYGGDYSAARLHRFHQELSRWPLAYEIW